MPDRIRWLFFAFFDEKRGKKWSQNGQNRKKPKKNRKKIEKGLEKWRTQGKLGEER